MRKIGFFLTLLLVICQAVNAQSQTSLTIYNDNFAVISQQHQFEFSPGINKLTFADVPATIDPTSILFQLVDQSSEIRVLEQSYQYDLQNTSRMLQAAMGRKIRIFTDDGPLAGTLRALPNNDIVIENNFGGLVVVSRDQIIGVALEDVPDNLSKSPTVQWLIDTDLSGQQKCVISYLADNINWIADYSAVMAEDEQTLTLTSWVTITNNTGKDFEDAQLQLIAGQVRRDEPDRREMFDTMAMVRAEAAMPAQQFEQAPLADYHLYTLDRTANISTGQTRQIRFMDAAADVSAERIYVYEKKPAWFYSRQNEEDHVQVRVEFENTEQNNLGMPLPMGRVRLFEATDMAPQFLGQDSIGHTPAGELVSLHIGNAFDITPEYTLVDSARGQRYERQQHRVELRNAKDTEVTVLVEHSFSAHRDWEIEHASQDYELVDAHTVRFSVDVPAESSAVVTYRTMETW